MHAGRDIHWISEMITKVLKKLKPQKPVLFSAYKLASRQTWIGNVEAVDEREAIEKAAELFKVTPMKLLGVRRR